MTRRSLFVLPIAVCSLTLWSGAASSALAQRGGQGASGRGADSRMAGTGRSPAGWMWWNDADIQRELGLTPDRVKRIDDLYQRRANDLKTLVDEFLKQQSELDKMTKAAVVDEPTYAVQVLRVESLRSRLNESRTVLLYRIYRELQPEQYRKLQDIFDRQAAQFGRGRGTPGR